MKVDVIPNACPACGGDLAGTKELKYLCKKCNILYSRVKGHVDHQESVSKRPVIMFIASLGSDKYHALNCPYFKNIKESNKVYFSSHKHAKENGYTPCICVKRFELKKKKPNYKFIASQLEEEFHTLNCPLAIRIKKENLVTFKSKQEAIKKGFKPGECLR